MVEKFKALIEDYKVTRNENEDFVWWYVQRVAPFNLRYVIAVALVLCIADIQYALTTVLVLWVIAATITIAEKVYRKRKQ